MGELIRSRSRRRSENRSMTLEQALQKLHQTGKPVEISWLWDGGIDVNAGGEEMNFKHVADVLLWLNHWYGLGHAAEADRLTVELQKMYDSEINVTIRTGGKRIFVGLGNSFQGFQPKGSVAGTSAGLPWLQRAIHEHSPVSQYDVERLGGTFTPEMAEIRNEPRT